MHTMKALIVAQAVALVSWGALTTVVPANSWADDSTPGAVRTRSIEDIHADLMRDWSAKPSGTFGEGVRTRSVEDAHADMMRDWGAKPSGTFGPGAQSRSLNDAYIELVRGSFVPYTLSNRPADTITATK
jgi:hypothetical protein